MPGRGKRESDEAVLRVFVEGDDPVYSAKQVADHLDIKKDATDKRLRGFQDRGLVASKKVGPARAWWLTEKGGLYLGDEVVASDPETVGPRER